MYTQCPDCQSVYRIGAEQLRAAQGRVRCGRCDTVFDALDHPAPTTAEPTPAARSPGTGSDATDAPTPFAEPPAGSGATPEMERGDAETGEERGAEPEWASFSEAHIETLLRTEERDPAQVPEPYARLDDLNLGTLRDGEESAPPAPTEPEPDFGPDFKTEFEPEPEPEPAKAPGVQRAPEPAESDADEPLAPVAAEDALPLQLEQRPARGRTGATLGWGLLALLLVAALGAQYAHFHPQQLAKRPGWRPYLEHLCALTGCQLPTRRDLTALELADHTVQSHPRQAGALLITATLRNRAAFAQPYPVVEVRMSDLQQRLVAARRFRPEEYLAGARPGGEFPAAAEAHLLLEVVDPGPEAVSFQFNFY